MIVCPRHADAAATFECPDCRAFACGRCAKTLVVRNKPIAQCPGCGGMLRAMVVTSGASRAARDARQHQVREVSLVGWLTDAARYVTRPSVLIAMVGLAVVAGICLWVSDRTIALYGAFMVLLARALEATTYFHVVERSAFGDDELAPPEYDVFWDSVLTPVLRYLVASLPLLAGLVWYAVASDTGTRAPLLLAADPWQLFDHRGPAVVVCAGLLLWPLTTLVAAITRSLTSTLHPLVWIDTVRAMGRDYALATVGFLAILAIETMVWMPFVMEFAARVPSTFLAAILVAFLGYLPMVMRARLLGTAVEPHI